MSSSALLLGMVLVAALSAVVGGLWILSKQQVVVTENGDISEIDIPFFGKLSTNYPSLIAILLGIALAWAVQSRLDIGHNPSTVPLTAKLALDGIPENSYVFVTAVPQRYLMAATNLSPGAENKITIDVDEPGPYSVIAFTVSDITPDGRSIYAITHGPAVLNAEPKGFVFAGHLFGSEE